jgi:hypothetical protein
VSKNWHPENLRRGRNYAFHLDDGGTVEIVCMIFDGIFIDSRTLMLRGLNVVTKENTAFAVTSVLEVQAAH